jgi:hypothetical protein
MKGSRGTAAIGRYTASLFAGMAVTIESALQMDLPRQVKNNVVRGLIERAMATRPGNVLQWADGWGDTWSDTWHDVVWDNAQWSEAIA